jgi:dTDP-4-amino-4,6-dideoxygalactose transaminase
MVTPIPLFDLAAQEASVAEPVLAAVARVARDATFILGPQVDAFEKLLARDIGLPHAVGVASGTDALELSLRALDIGPGDAVVTPALSFIAAAEAIVTAGARPVFCDVDESTMTASGRTLEQAVARARANGLRVRALLPVHLFGRCAPAQEVAELARREGLAVLEDAAQAFGARDDQGRPAGAAGDAACFSFFPTKCLGCWGDGGAIVTPREAIAERVRRLRAHGARRPYLHEEIGRNSRLDALQAAVLLAKFDRVAPWREARARLASGYRAGLADLPLVLPDDPSPPARHTWHAFVIRCTNRDALAARLAERGVQTRVYYPVPLHRQACFAPFAGESLPVAEGICERALALPIFPTMSDAQQGRVVDEVRRFFRS